MSFWTIPTIYKNEKRKIQRERERERLRYFAVVTDGEGVSAAGDDGAETLRFESFDERDPFFLFVVADS